MSTRRAPLSSNPNAANSPIRGGGSASALHAKAKRSFANMQREEAYGQPPPLKKQILDNGNQRAVRSPSTLAQRSRNLLQVQRSKPRGTVASTEASQKAIQQEREFLNWQKQHRAKFPSFVFYFDSVPDDVRARLLKHIGYLGAREEKFFSIDVTHVVTTRSVPPPEVSTNNSHAPESSHAKHETDEQPQTINPSLLDCSTESRRKMLFELGSRRAHPQEDIVKLKASRNTDVLYKARSMGKRIYTIEKLQRILDNLLSGDEHASKSLHMRQQSHETNLAKLLQNERINGPSDRDPRAVTRELNYFRGPYIYVYDMDEKTKPIMVREYAKVVDKAEGEWPQFKTVSQGRCPFVDESAENKIMKRAMEKKKEARATAEKPVVDNEKASKAGSIASSKRIVPGKRARDDYADPLAEMRNIHNKVPSARPTELFNPPRDLTTKNMDFGSQKFFTGRNGNGRMFAGEPVASGVQPSNVTSAIRSQMISSNANAPGAKAGTSREVHNLQKKVLSKSNAASQDASSRRIGTGQSMDGLSSRSASFSKASGRAFELVEEVDRKEKRTVQCKTQGQVATVTATVAPVQKSKKDMKPGYCENCQDKFADFDDHIVSRKHRRFAESKDNWVELDDLLSLLKREPKHPHLQDERLGVKDVDGFDYWH